VYLYPQDLSVINGCVLFCFATLGTLLLLLHLPYCWFLVTVIEEGNILNYVKHEGCGGNMTGVF